MLSYRIKSKRTYNIRDTSDEATFERAITACRFSVGDRIKLRGTPRKGYVTEIVQDITRIKWMGRQPQFILITMDDLATYIAANSQLKKVSQ